MPNRYPQFVSKHLTVKSRSGYEWQCLCPYHEDSSPSFSVNVHKGVFVCYACGAKGKMDDLAKHLAVSKPVPDEPSIAEIEEKIGEITAPPVPAKHVYSDYWKTRYRIDGITWSVKWSERIHLAPAISEMFALGYDHIQDELVIPIFDWNGSAEACVRRRLSPGAVPKYLYSKGFKTSNHLYGAWQVRSWSGSKRPHRVAIVEGTIDALSMWNAGCPAVAILGSNLSATQKKLLLKLDALEYVVMTDNDAAGRKAALQIEQAMKGCGSLITVAKWSSLYKDPAELPAESRRMVFEASGIKTVVPLSVRIKEAMQNGAPLNITTIEWNRIEYDPNTDIVCITDPLGLNVYKGDATALIDLAWSPNPATQQARHYLSNISPHSLTG